MATAPPFRLRRVGWGVRSRKRMLGQISSRELREQADSRNPEPRMFATRYAHPMIFSVMRSNLCASAFICGFILMEKTKKADCKSTSPLTSQIDRAQAPPSQLDPHPPFTETKQVKKGCRGSAPLPAGGEGHLITYILDLEPLLADAIVFAQFSGCSFENNLAVAHHDNPV